MATKTKKNLKDSLKGLKADELKKQLDHLQEEVRLLKFKAEGSRSKNVKEVSSLKKQIARILTEINKK